MSVDVKKLGSKSAFVRLGPGIYGLRSLHAESPTPTEASPVTPPDHGRISEGGLSDSSRRVRVPLFPLYREVRHLLKVWPGRLKADITGLHRALEQLRGTPRIPVDWTKPDVWIPERLSADIRDLAMTIWIESGHDVNPRYTYGHWLLVRKYDLLEAGSDGILQLTERVRDFVEHKGGRTEVFLD